jgi:hypothetical protein
MLRLEIRSRCGRQGRGTVGGIGAKWAPQRVEDLPPRLGDRPHCRLRVHAIGPALVEERL